MQNYKKNIYFCINYESKYRKTLISLSFYSFIETLPTVVLPYHRYMDSLFHECARHTTEPRHAHWQVDTLYHVRLFVPGDWPWDTKKPQTKTRWTVATTEAAACLHVATTHTDEWPYRAIASLLHGWTPQWRMARLCGQRYRCYDRHHYRYSVGKVSRQRQKGFVSRCEL